MGGLMDGRMGIWMGGSVKGRTDRRMDEWMGG